METRAIVTIAVNDYRPEICAMTFPNLKAYADRCRADHIIVTERKFPEWHPAYEKCQAWEISESYTKTMLIDADIALHPRLIDMFEVYPLGGTGSWMKFDINNDTLNLGEIENDPLMTP